MIIKSNIYLQNNKWYFNSKGVSVLRNLKYPENIIKMSNHILEKNLIVSLFLHFILYLSSNNGSIKGTCH